MNANNHLFSLNRIIKASSDPETVSVILVNYNSERFLVECIKSVLKTRYPRFEIIVVDNASIAGSLEKVRMAFQEEKKIRFIQSASNLGFAGGNNLGIESSEGDYIALLNPDTVVHPDWISNILDTFGRDRNIGVVQPKILLGNHSNVLDSVGHYLDPLGIESLRSESVTGELDRGQYDSVKEIFYAKGAAMVLRRSVLRDAGVFDPSYFTDHEEIDLCWRVHLAGYAIVYTPHSIIYHWRAGPSWKFRSEKPTVLLFHLRKNHLSSLIKNYESFNMVKFSTIYLIFLYLHGLFKLSKRDVRTLSTYFSATMWVLTNFRFVWKNRLWIQRSVRKVPDSEVMRTMTPLVVPLHFL